MRTETVGEPIDVGVVFKDGAAPSPRWFVWSGRKHAVAKVEHVWKSRDGRMALWGYSVSSGTDVYELLWNSHTLRWTLEKVHLNE